MQHITDIDGKKHLNDTVHAFDAIVVVRGFEYNANDDKKATIRRIDTAIERVFEMQRPLSKQLIWHHGPTISPLLSWIHRTSSELRSSLTAISVTAALDLANGVKPSPLGKANKLPDLKKLEEYAKRLSIPVVFVDPASQLIQFEDLATYMYYWAYYIHTFLPGEVLRPHFYKSLDSLVTFAFCLRGASEGVYGTDMVRMVQKHLSGSLARRWARTCIDPSSYTTKNCRAAAEESAIHHAVQLADGPFATFSRITGYAVPAFSRLPLCPSEDPANITGGTYTAAPVKFDWDTCAFRATSARPFYIMLPREGQDVQSITAHIQGLMMGVLESVRKVKSKDACKISKTEGELWAEVVKVCIGAIDKCKGKMPDKVEGRVKYVREKLSGGSFSYSAGIAKNKPTTGGQWQAAAGANGWGNGPIQQALNAQGGQAWPGGGGYHTGQSQGGANWQSSHQNQNNGGWSSDTATAGDTWG